VVDERKVAYLHQIPVTHTGSDKCALDAELAQPELDQVESFVVGQIRKSHRSQRRSPAHDECAVRSSGHLDR
jgi:hypothetical protein